MQLSAILAIAPRDLPTVSFDDIAALHAEDPFAGRRLSLGRRRSIEQGFVAAAPRETSRP
jgi:hypothetical protein